jgi:hypothetical protein
MTGWVHKRAGKMETMKAERKVNKWVDMKVGQMVGCLGGR